MEDDQEHPKKVTVTRDQLLGIIELIDGMNADAISFDVDMFQEQVNCYSIKPVNPQ